MEKFGTMSWRFDEMPLPFEIASANNLAWRMPMDESMTRSCSTAKERTSLSLRVSNATTYSGRMSDKRSAKMTAYQLRQYSKAFENSHEELLTLAAAMQSSLEKWRMLATATASNVVLRGFE